MVVCVLMVCADGGALMMVRTDGGVLMVCVLMVC